MSEKIYTVETMHAARITNTHIHSFSVPSAKVAGATRPADKVIAESPVDLWAFDLKSGTMKKRVTLQPVAKADNVAFAAAVRSFWYHRQLDAVDDAARMIAGLNAALFDKAIADAGNTDAAKTYTAARDMYVALNARVTSLREVLKAFTEYTPGDTVRAYVAAIRGDKMEEYPHAVRDCLKPVRDELRALDKVDTEAINVKKLREKVNDMTQVLWVKNDREGVEAFMFRCNDALARDVYRVAYKGRAIDHNGNVNRLFNDEKVLLSEVVLACIESLQAKYKKARLANTKEKDGDGKPAETPVAAAAESVPVKDESATK